MAKVKGHHFPEPHDYDTWVDMGPEQEEAREDRREASNLAAFVALMLFIGVAAGWAGILIGRI